MTGGSVAPDEVRRALSAVRQFGLAIRADIEEARELVGYGAEQGLSLRVRRVYVVTAEPEVRRHGA